MSEGDLYERYQSLTALVAVLAHELRNPLHGATLLVEAMGLPGADVGALRQKLRAQLSKMDALVSEVVDPAREMTIEPALATLPLLPLLEAVRDGLAEEAALAGTTIEVRAPGSLAARGDARIVARIIAGLGARALATPSPTANTAAWLVLSASEDGTTAAVRVEDHRPPVGGDARRG